MEEAKTTILIIEDDLDVADMLNAYFRVQGYEILTAYWGEDGVRAAQTNQPSLVILDIRLPDIDGYEVARQLKTNRRTENIPIIFLTEKRERMDRLKGLELHAEDYITKPFDIQELRLKVRNTLLRAQQGTLTNPVTGLPEGKLVDEKLSDFLTNSGEAILTICLQNFESFRERYGFVAADDLLRAVAIMLEEAVREIQAQPAFLGQLSATHFLVITPAVNLPILTERCSKRLNQSFDYFYSSQDRISELLKQHPLTATLNSLTAAQSTARTLDQLKQEIEQLTHQERN